MSRALLVVITLALVALAGLGWFLWRRSMLGTIVVGMLVFTVLRLVF